MYVRCVNRDMSNYYSQVSVSADAGLFSYFPGQFAFLQFPTVSTLQWHPFTISSAPSSDRITFHIKNTGPKAFTGQLAEQARLMRESIVGARVV